jgi:polar amino acid transport system substrate-binding protein
VESEFYPWARAVMTTETGKGDILYPEYFIEEDAPSDWFKDDTRRDHLALSKQIPGGPIAFMKRDGDGNYYDGDLRELEGERIGVVRGYQNTPDFDRLMDKGVFNEQPVENDTLNARKLANGRVNLIVGDPAVIRYSVANADMAEDEKEDILDTLTVEEPVLQYNHLYYAVSKEKDGWQNTLADLNEAITEFHDAGTTVALIRETAAECSHGMDATLEPYLDD